MIIIKNNSRENKVFFPKNSTNSDKHLILRLHSLVENRDYTFEVDDIMDMRDYYCVLITLNNVPEGEYEYVINDEKGLMIIGDYKEERKESTIKYNREIEYIQYGG